MSRGKQLKPLFSFFTILACAGYAVPATAGVSLPSPQPPPGPTQPDEQYPDSCLDDGDFFLDYSYGGDIEFYDSSYGGYGSVSPEELNEDGLCSTLNQGSTVIGDEVTRMLMTEYFNRLNSNLQSRILSGFFGGGSDIASQHNPNQKGRAAGDGLADWGGWSPWVSYSHTMADNDLPSTRYDADQDNILFGMDYSYSDRLIFGISGAYENNDIDTGFNLGQMEVSGFTVAPYAAYLLNDSVSIDASFGYSDLEIDQYRTEFGGARVTGNTDSSRWFVMTNLNAYQRYGNWMLTGRAGLVYSEEEQDAFTETGGTTAQFVPERNIDFGQLTIGGEAAYSVHSVEPFVSLYYEYDFEQGSTALNTNQVQPSNDDDDFRFSTGLRFFSDMGITATMEYSKIIDRDNFDSDTISIIGRMQF